MRNPTLRRLIGLLFLAGVAQAQTSEAFIELADKSVPGALRDYNVPGLAAALIRHGAVVWMKGYGFADVAFAKPITPDTAFNVGSLSKTATAWGVMRLVERRKVELDRPVDDYLKGWRLPPSQFDAKQVTIRRVLSHTAGISNHDYHGWDATSPLPPIIDSLSGKTGTGKVRVVSPPGTGFRYSGADYAIMQLLIESLSGLSFQDYMKAEVFQPLGMKDTWFGLPLDFARIMALPYGPFAEPLPRLRYNELAAAGLTTTLRDLATLAAAGLKGPHGARPGRGVLEPQTIEVMQTPQPHTRWADRDPYGPNPQYGLGYTVRPDQFAGEVGIGHGGTNRGWESLMQIIPATGDGIVLMTNSSNGGAVISTVLCSWRKWAVQGAPGACPAIDIRAELYGVYGHKGVEAALDRYRELRRSDSDKYDFSVNELNSMGYEILRRGDKAAAVEIFKLNAEQFPHDWNVYDSLGEALLKAGDKPHAIESYRKSVELNPQNGNGRNALQSLGASIQ
ncbi:MAG TPA: serine hydrolase [Bryobacteraceae bacterium]|jgi:CubicO group peptidase (beta-lactamase class C family)